MSHTRQQSTASGKRGKGGNRSRTPLIFSAQSLKAKLPNETLLISDQNKLTREESKKYHPRMKIGSPMAYVIELNQQFFLLCITGECGKSFNRKNIKKATQFNGEHCKPRHPNIPIQDIEFMVFSHWSLSQDRKTYEHEHILIDPKTLTYIGSSSSGSTSATTSLATTEPASPVASSPSKSTSSSNSLMNITCILKTSIARKQH